MTQDCNQDLIKQARLNLTERYVQTYHVNAILKGDWDKGSIMQEEVESLLKQPPIAEGGDE